MAHVDEREIVLFGPEERHGVETFSTAEHVARRSHPLTLGHDPMLDTDALAREPIRPARDIASGEDAGHARLEVFVHGNATIDGEACVLSQRHQGTHPDADDDEVGL